MPATVTMSLETLRAIIEHARDFELDDQEIEALSEQEDDEALSDELEVEDDSELSAASDDESDDDLDDDEFDEEGEEDEETEDFDIEDVLAELSPEEVAELLAVSWVGEGEYAPSEWSNALSDAKEMQVDDAIAELADNPTLARSIERGLTELGYKISEA